MFQVLCAEGRALVCNFGLYISPDRERHNGPFIQFFPASGCNAFFPEQHFAEALWVVAQVKGSTGPFFSHRMLLKSWLYFGSWRVRRLRTQDVDQRATFQIVTAGVAKVGGGGHSAGLVTICINCPTLKSPYRPCSWGSRVPCGSTARSPDTTWTVEGSNFCPRRWTTEPPEARQRSMPAGRMTWPPGPGTTEEETGQEWKVDRKLWGVRKGVVGVLRGVWWGLDSVSSS